MSSGTRGKLWSVATHNTPADLNNNQITNDSDTEVVVSMHTHTPRFYLTNHFLEFLQVRLVSNREPLGILQTVQYVIQLLTKIIPVFR